MAFTDVLIYLFLLFQPEQLLLMLLASMHMMTSWRSLYL